MTESNFPLIKQISEMPRAKLAGIELFKGEFSDKHRVLLVGVYSEEMLRPGLSEINWDEYGEKFDTIFTMFRFLDIEDMIMFDIKTADLKKFLAGAVCVNASFRVNRPMVITMQDGGRFEDLPVLANTSGNATKNDSFLLNYNCGKYPILVHPDGRYGALKPKRVIQWRLEHRCKFYNL